MIRIIIEREIAQGLEQFYETAIGDLLDAMINAPGYLAGESLVDIHHPNRYVVVTRWSSEEAWNRWIRSAERQQLVNELRPFLLKDEKFTLLRTLKYHRGD